MMIRRSTDGAFQVLDISNNKVIGAAPIGQVGNEWQVAGFGDFNGDGTADMLMRRTSDGAFTFYDLSANKIIASGRSAMSGRSKASAISSAIASCRRAGCGGTSSNHSSA